MREQLRNFVFTLNQVTQETTIQEMEIILKTLNPNYYIIGNETGQSGNKHYQGYVELNKLLDFNTIHKTLKNAHIEPRKGTQVQAIEYCKKENNYIEWGTPKAQGKRNDLEEIVELVKQGATDLEILNEYPTQFLMYNQHIQKIREVATKEKYKEIWRDLTVIYIWGETGTGKSKYVRDKYGNKNIYAVNSYGSGAFDSYTNEDVLVLEEFRNDFTIKFMLQLLDGYPLRLPARYYDKIACYTKVFILSNIPFEDQYKQAQIWEPASYQALERRITCQIGFSSDITENIKTMDLLEPIISIKNPLN